MWLQVKLYDKSCGVAELAGELLGSYTEFQPALHAHSVGGCI
jgi:hypothetical protein